ncbi:Arginine--tRNA ligase, cytoplasmic [Talaromyces pinophilus]|nr:Arginine--tRNA ligase, cytoplasmic [Talaromyces pinophilus]
MTTSTVTDLEALLAQLGVKVPIPQFPAADVLKRPLDIGRSYLADIFCSLLECDPDVAYKSIHWPNDISSGDLAVILPKLSQGGDSNAVGFDLINKFPERSLFVLPFHDGVHLRIMFNPNTLPRLLLPYMNDRRDSYGRDDSIGLRDLSPEVGRKRLLVEFSSPNIASEFQARHLRSTIIGAYIANQYENMGWDVTRLNYLGDWGKPIGLLGVAWEKFGSEELFQADPAGHLHDIYHKILELFVPEQAASKKVRDEGGDPATIESQGLFAERNAFFKRVEEDDEQAVALWKRAREVNIKQYTELYARLNVTFDEYSGESQVKPETMAEVEEILKSKGISEESAGSWIIDLKKHSKLSGTAIIRDRTGSSTYLLRDLAAVLERSRKYSFDKMIYVVAADQHTTHFARLFKILELMDMPDLASKLQHVHFSNVSKMSEKLGHGHTLDEILDQVQKATHDSLEMHPDMASVLGHSENSISSIAISALVAGELSTRRAQDHAFEVTRMTSFEPGTGPHLQYWYARLSTILDAYSTFIAPPSEEFDPLSDEECSLLRLLVQYPDITHLAYESLEPATIMTHLVNLALQISICLDDCDGKVIDSLTQANLYDATRRVMESGMKVLGITPVRTPQTSAPEENPLSEHLMLPEENSPVDAQHTVQGDLPNEETPVSDNVQLLDEVQISGNDPALDEIAIPNDAASIEVLSDPKETSQDDGNVPEAVQSFEDGTPDDDVPVDKEVAVPDVVTSTGVLSDSKETPVDDEKVPNAIKEGETHDIVPVNKEAAVPDDATAIEAPSESRETPTDDQKVPEAIEARTTPDVVPVDNELAVSDDVTTNEVPAESKKTPTNDDNVPEAIQICEDGTPHDAVPVDGETAGPEEHVSEVIQSSEESALPQESSPPEALGTLDENVLEEMHNSEDRSPDLLPASDDVPTHPNQPQDTPISEEIKPSVEIQVM